MDTTILFFAFFAGLLTILAPCVLPLLPVIVGKSATEHNKKYIVVTVIALGISIFFFGLLLRASTTLIDVPDTFWKILSGGILFILGFFFLIPEFWDWISIKMGLNSTSNTFLSKVSTKGGFIGSVLTGIALGPVFLSCSPTYAAIIALILNGAFFEGALYLASYAIGFSLVMFAVSIYGYTLINKLKWATDPHGVFKRVIAVVFILVGWSVMFGIDKQIETYFTEKVAGTSLDVAKFEQEYFEID